MYPLPTPVRVIAAVVGDVMILVAGAMGVASVGMMDRPAWTFFGFQVVIAVAAGLGIVMGFGKFRQGPGMALACIAGTIFAASVLAYLSMQPPEIAGRSLKPWLLGSVAAAGVLGVLGAYCVLSRDPRSWPALVKGLVLGLPVAMTLGVLKVPAARGLVHSMLGGGVVTVIVVSVAAFLVLGALLCASADLIIRAFEYGRAGGSRN